jgi:hypothetical protein
MDVLILYKNLEITDAKPSKQVAKEPVEEKKETQNTQLPNAASNEQDSSKATNAQLDHEPQVIQQQLVRELEVVPKKEIQ